MRTFIALELPESFTDEVAGMARVLSASVEGRFMKRDTYHITLAFLGDVNEGAVRDACDAIDNAVVGFSGVPLRSNGLGKFGRASDATLWLGIASDVSLMQLIENVRACLTERSISFDDKPFRPHITLARRARIPKQDLPALPFPADAEAVAVTLFKSELSHKGATYKPLYSVSLSHLSNEAISKLDEAELDMGEGRVMP